MMSDNDDSESSCSSSDGDDDDDCSRQEEDDHNTTTTTTTLDRSTLYSILNVSQDASLLEIQRSYKYLSKTFHPDKSMDNSKNGDLARSVFDLVKLAHDVLTDALLRFSYNHGGMLAVTLVRRLQQQQQSSSSSSSNDSKDLLKQLEQDVASNPRKAKQTLDDLVEEHALQQTTSRSTSNTSSASFGQPLYIPSKALLLSPVVRQWQLQTRQTYKDYYQCSVSTTCQVQETAESELQTVLSVETTPMPGTQVYTGLVIKGGPILSMKEDSSHNTPAARNGGAGAAAAKTESPLYSSSLQRFQILLRSSRQFSNGTVTLLALQSPLANLSNANYSFTSIRNIHIPAMSSANSSHGNDQQQQQQQQSPPTVLQASWRVGWQPFKQRMTMVMLSLKNLVFPQYNVKLTSTGIVKVKFIQDQENGLQCSYTTGLLLLPTNKWKITWVSEWQQWRLQYGIKHELVNVTTRGSIMSSQWSVICNVNGPDWNIKVPILCGVMPGAPIVWMTSLLVGQVLDHFLETWQNNGRMTTGKQQAGNKKDTKNNSSGHPVRLAEDAHIKDMIRRTAEKKRVYEASIRGLVILDAKSSPLFVSPPDKHLSWAQMLQFWVVDSQLNVNLDQLQWMNSNNIQSRETDATTLQSWWNMRLYYCQWWSRPNYESPISPLSLDPLLVIRYQYKGLVYEISTTISSSRIQLPCANATCLGPIEQVL
jgi:curved DNA-binding protein CbpA